MAKKLGPRKRSNTTKQPVSNTLASEKAKPESVVSKKRGRRARPRKPAVSSIGGQPSPSRPTVKRLFSVSWE